MSEDDLVKELRGIEWGRHGCMTRAADRIEALVARVAELEEALSQLAEQRKSSELKDFDMENADFEGAYDIMINCARAALGEAS